MEMLITGIVCGLIMAILVFVVWVAIIDNNRHKEINSLNKRIDNLIDVIADAIEKAVERNKMIAEILEKIHQEEEM